MEVADTGKDAWEEERGGELGNYNGICRCP